MKGKDFFEQAKNEFIKGRHRESISMFDKALEDNYEPVQTLLSRGAAYLNIHEFHKALEDFNQVLEKDENNERAYYYRGVTRMNLGDYQNAAADLDHSLFLNAERGAAYLARGITRAELGMEEAAAEDFKQAVAHSNVEVENFVNMFGANRTMLDRSIALLEGERGPLTMVLNEEEIEKLKKWMD